MEPTKIAEVYETYDYDKFKKLAQNRGVVDPRKEKLMASLSEKAIMNPILVDSKYRIIDGQGRFEARKALGLPIPYIVDGTLVEEDCVLLNRYNTNWKQMDFVESFAKGGNENYVNIVKAMKETGATIKYILDSGFVSGYRGGGANGPDNLKNGKLIFSGESKTRFIVMFKSYKQLLEDLDKDKGSPVMFRAFSVCFQYKQDGVGYDHAWMRTSAKKSRYNFSVMNNLTDMLQEFERIYNYGLRQDKRLRFSEYMKNKGHNVRSY